MTGTKAPPRTRAGDAPPDGADGPYGSGDGDGHGGDGGHDGRAGGGGDSGWVADLAMGARFAFGGGREGWTRTLLTAVGVGLGVAVLLLAASVPHMLGARDARTDARDNMISTTDIEKSDRSALQLSADTEYHGDSIRGRVLDPEGSRPPVPPGLDKVPAPGEMVVSPALKKVLESDDGALLRERLPYRITGTIADEGLAGPSELTYYAGSDDLRLDPENEGFTNRIDKFDEPAEAPPLPPELVVLIIVICVVLLLPVGAFIAAAVRFGGERRDRRLAALRLVGADTRMTRRVAAGEAASGALLGLLVGTAVFLPLRQLIATVESQDLTVFASDVTPSIGLAALIALGVPGCAIAVTLLALRGVVIEPLGVVRKSSPPKRRLWWRLLPTVLGLALLVPTLNGFDSSSTIGTYQVAAGIVLILVGVTALLPWLVEAVVRRLRGGAVPFQLAVRRLQLDSGTAARAVSGITVAVAGAIALQMLFTAVQEDQTQRTGRSEEADVMVMADLDSERYASLPGKLARTEGVADSLRMTTGYTVLAGEGEDSPGEQLTVADCATLKRIAKLPSCRNGDSFLLDTSESQSGRSQVRAGSVLDLTGGTYAGKKHKPELWTVPKGTPQVEARPSPLGDFLPGIIATPGAVDMSRVPDASSETYLTLDPENRDALEHVRNTTAAADPALYVMTLKSEATSGQFDAIQRGLYVGAVGILLLIGASMVVSTLEQLRERKRLLSVLIAFGTRRSTLAWSVLWQTALPVVLGMALAAATGLGLGVVLLRMTEQPLAVDWLGLGVMTGLGGVLILFVTLLSMPLLWRLMRPDGLRTE
ncbi:ABC transporter permease [Streptomyces armeniacus]|uniref:ABC transporter permease n=1 Tax=Streptomyces armeniacus TaxID=83291 RepID=A0A345XWY5_9ACTN|nr:FtsX-like permease family protein [Streptomyces armeniacus]AXK36151.1 ABC transporter permease [Streptomyces armeniacus]